MLYTLYIDEAGDEGFGKPKIKEGEGQSRWFALGGILVSEENDKLLPKWRDEINSRISPHNKKREVHFRKLNHEQKTVACQILAQKEIHTSVMLYNKALITKDRLKEKEMMYYCMIYNLLIEFKRFCDINFNKNDGTFPKIKIVFSERKATDYARLKKVLLILEEEEDKNNYLGHENIKLSSIAVESHVNRAGLQLADIVTSAYFAGFEPNFYGNTEIKYGNILKKTLLNHINEPAFMNGLLIYPADSFKLFSLEQLLFSDFRKK